MDMARGKVRLRPVGNFRNAACTNPAAFHVTVLELARPGLAPVLELCEEIERQPEFVYRTNNSGGYLPVRDRSHAAALLASRTANDPWVTLFFSLDPTNGPFFQVLGTSAGMIVEGGTAEGKYWRASALPFDGRLTTVGPSWYEESCHESQVLTIHDALRMFLPVFLNGGFLEGVAGYEALWYNSAG
jgi:hypothetical protein